MRIVRRGQRYFCEVDRPISVAHLEKRRRVSVALRTDSLEIAKAKATHVEAEIRSYWQALENGRSDDAQKRFEAAQSIARQYGFPYRSSEQIARGELEELLTRIEALERTDAPTETHVDGLLGTAERPKLLISAALDEYVAHHRTELSKKSDKQRHRWEIMRRRAIKNFIDVVGDKSLEDVTRQDALEFRDWWTDRLEAEGLTPDSPNKDLQNLSSVFQLVVDRRRLDLENPFKGLRFKDDEDRRPPPFERDWILSKIFPALLDLKDDERAVMVLLAELGLRPSEACNLLAAHIHLDHEIPHLEIAAQPGRQLKTKHARRKLPLIGASLAAMRGFPSGFERFRDREANFCSRMNKWLRDQELRPTPRHVIYSFRHGFADRLRTARCSVWVQDSVMGHAPKGENYGAGPTLDQVRDEMSSVALVASS